MDTRSVSNDKRDWLKPRTTKNWLIFWATFNQLDEQWDDWMKQISIVTIFPPKSIHSDARGFSTRKNQHKYKKEIVCFIYMIFKNVYLKYYISKKWAWYANAFISFWYYLPSL